MSIQGDHAGEVLALEVLGWNRLRRIMGRFRRDVRSRVLGLFVHLGDDVVQPGHAATIMFEIGQLLGGMLPQALASLAAITASALDAGGRQALVELGAAERGPGGDRGRARMIEDLHPEFPESEANRVYAPQPALIDRFGQVLTDAARDALQVSLDQGEGIKPATARLSEVMNGQAWQLERIARTEINDAVNEAHDATLAIVADEFPEMDLWKQWSADSWSERTCEWCQELDGQVQRIGVPFVCSDGWSGQSPTKHPACRCRENPWSPRWEEGKAPKYVTKADGQEVDQMPLDDLSELPMDVRKRFSPSAQNAYRKAFNATRSVRAAELAAIAKDGEASGPTVSDVHVDVPLGAGKKKPRILKSDNPKRYTLGIVYEPDVEDTQGDFATADEIEQACWDFNRRRIGTGREVEACVKGALGVQHATWLDSHGEIIESYIAPCGMRVGQEEVAAGTWLMGVIWSLENWAKIQAGELTGYSMGGSARRVPVA